MGNDLSPIWEILKITLPALIVFLTAYFLFRDMLESSEKQRELDFRVTNSKQVLPIRLQAYERLAMLLERISPQNLLIRVPPHDLKASDFHHQLLANIRQEFEHNLSQQIYVTPQLWEIIRKTRENLVSIINKSAEEIDLQAPALLLSNKIIENYIAEQSSLITLALNELKKETGKLF